MTRGLFLAIDDAHLRTLRSTKGDPARRELLAEWEEAWGRNELPGQDTDKAWYFLYLCFGVRRLRDGMLAAASGPLGTLFRMGKEMHRGESTIINVVLRPNVPAVAKALGDIDEPWLRKRYDRLSPDYFRPGEFAGTDAEFRYVFTWFEKIRAFVAAHQNENLVFNVEW